jgi:hypothetical protein
MQPGVRSAAQGLLLLRPADLGSEALCNVLSFIHFGRVLEGVFFWVRQDSFGRGVRQAMGGKGCWVCVHGLACVLVRAAVTTIDLGLGADSTCVLMCSAARCALVCVAGRKQCDISLCIAPWLCVGEVCSPAVCLAAVDRVQPAHWF